MIKPKYQTDDGTLFDDWNDAYYHEMKVKEKALADFLHSHTAYTKDECKNLAHSLYIFKEPILKILAPPPTMEQILDATEEEKK